MPVLGDIVLVLAPPPMASAASAEWRVLSPRDPARLLGWSEVQLLHRQTSPVPRDEAELRWRPEAYHSFLASCFTAAGGTLPPLRWSPALHPQFPAGFRRAAAALRRSRLPAPVQHLVCEYLSDWHGDVPLRTLQEVGLLRVPPHLVTVEMAFNSMLGCDLRHQRRFFRQFAELCAEKRSLGQYDKLSLIHI